MGRIVILRVCEDDPACERARELVPRVAADLGLELQLQWYSPDSGYPLPQLYLWDGTLLEHVADEAALRETIAAKLRAEDAAEDEAARERARREAERRAEAERNASSFAARRARAAEERARRAAETSRPVEPGSPPAAIEQGPAPEPSHHRAAPALVLAPPPPPSASPPSRLDALRRRLLRAAQPSPRLRKLLAVGVAAAVFLLGDFFGVGPFSGSPEPGPAADRPAVEAPAVDLPTLDGFRFDLERERGRAILLVVFDARQPDVRALAALGALAGEAEVASERARGDAQVVALGAGLGLEELRTAVGEPPHALVVAADAQGAAAKALATVAGKGAWWLVDRAGRVVARGEEWPGPEAVRALVAVGSESTQSE
jgi:hypothetical protein